MPQPDRVYDQIVALSTLLHLDAVLGAERASPYLAAGGLWQHWTDATPYLLRDPQKYRQVVDQLCSFASECSELLAGTEPRN
ncbi:DUF6000 family protein [Streptomyces lavendofoliae]|uniref:DUF6000 family protein n=1 Tax=Streptomyces lavendofoliae TaxID=67314 RepID=UPI0027E4B9B6|nr:DUF6000 family protein [Streptomyces lavendofoliae]